MPSNPLRRLLPLTFAAASVLTACKNDATSPRAALTASLASAELTAAAPHATVTLGGPDGAEWSVLAAPSWLHVAPREGVLGRDETVALDAPDLASLPPGAYSGDVVLGTGRSSVSVRVSARVAANPTGAWSVSQLQIGEAVDTASVTLTNEGNVALEWRVLSTEPWLSTSPSSGRLRRGESAVVRARVDKRGLPGGESSAALRLTGGAAEVVLPVTVSVSNGPAAGFSASRLVFAPGRDSAAIVLRNGGRAPLDWSVQSAPTWLSLVPDAGSLGAGAELALTGVVDRGRVPSGQQSDSIVFATNAGAVVLPVVVADESSLSGGLWRLGARVAAASFDRHADRLVIVNRDAAELLVLDMSAGIMDRIALPSLGHSLALSPDGRLASVTHEAYVSVIDLASRRVVASAPAARARFSAIGNDGWVHVFPLYGMWDYFRSINPFTGEQGKDPWIVYGNSGKIHPSGDYIYAQNGWSLEKWDIRAGPARFLYESPIYGPYGYAGEVWLSEDGSRIYTASRQAFRTEPEREWEHLGELPLPRTVGSLAHSAAANRLFAFTAPSTEWWREGHRGDDVQLAVMDATTLAALDPIPLPTFDVPDGAGGVTRHPVLGRFVFAASSGDRVYVLVQVSPDAGLPADWAVATLATGVAP